MWGPYICMSEYEHNDCCMGGVVIKMVPILHTCLFSMDEYY